MRARAEDLLDYLRAPGLLRAPEVADGLEADLRRRGLSTAAQARQRLGWELSELDRLAVGDDPADGLVALARRLFAAPHRARAAQLSDEEALDAGALSALVSAVEQLSELRLTPSAAELIELLAGLAVKAPDAPGPIAGSGRVLLAEPAEIRPAAFEPCSCAAAGA